MSVTPSYLQNISGNGATWGNDEYHYYQTINAGLADERYVYALAWVTAPGVFGGWTGTPADYSISVYTNPSHANYNTWTDYGSNHPHTVSESSGVCTLSSSSLPLLFAFTKPTTASWISSSGGSGGSGGQPLSNTGLAWSYNKSTGKVSVEDVFQDNGAAGFPPLISNVDVGLARITGQTFADNRTLANAHQDPNNGFALYDGSSKTLTLHAEPGSRWGVINATTLDQFGDSYKVPGGRVSSNFW